MEKYPVTEQIQLVPHTDGVTVYVTGDLGRIDRHVLSVAEAYGVWGWLMRWIEEREAINQQKEG